MIGLADGPQFRPCLGRNLIDQPLIGGHGSIQDATEAPDKGGDEGSRPRPSEDFPSAAPYEPVTLANGPIEPVTLSTATPPTVIR